MKTLLILGASSDVAIACADIFAKNGFNLQLASRNTSLLESYKLDLIKKYKVDIKLIKFDILDYDNNLFYEKLNPIPDVCLCTVGYLENEPIYQDEIIKTIRTNFEGPVISSFNILKLFKKNNYGTIIVLSSIAGERARNKNLYYSSSKAALTFYLQGLRNLSLNSNVKVITVIPGYIKTKMIKDIKTPSLITSSPKKVAKIIFDSFSKKKEIVYSSFSWKLISIIIKLLPNKIIKFLKI